MRIYKQGLGPKLDLRIVQFNNIRRNFTSNFLKKFMKKLGYSLYYDNYYELSFSKPIKI